MQNAKKFYNNKFWLKFSNKKVYAIKFVCSKNKKKKVNWFIEFVLFKKKVFKLFCAMAIKFINA